MAKDQKYPEFMPSEIEQKWQQKWEEDKVFSPDVDKASNPYFNLMMFPYPSAEGLHVGNMYAFTGADVYAKFNRMQGKDVLEPIGLDGFGIHSENYALKVGRHPKEQAELSEKNFYRQLRSIGNSFDWQRTVETYNPDYYKWTQWLFIRMFKNGLAYRDTALVNWCPKDLTVLSDEQVIDGKCERCGSEVEKRELEQWFFRITKYASRLLENIDSLKWSERVKIAQRNWIGKSEGAEIEFRIDNSEISIRVFTTRPDTLHGATFMVIAPEHQLALSIANGAFPNANDQAVKEYIEKVKSKSEIERTGEGKEKSGVVTGLMAINPVNGQKIPVLVCDYVLGGYGTGAIMAVPAHDQRDWETAKAFDLPIVPVISRKNDKNTGTPVDEAYEGSGILIGSKDWNGWEVPTDIPKVISWLEERGIGTRKANFHLRDWLISRQRYWGPPIPLIFCSECSKNGKAEVEGMNGWFSVPEANLPVLLPDVADWKPMGTGKSPLANHPEFYEAECPNCGAKAMRETDVSDTFLDSAWYFLRYPSTDIEVEAFDIERTKKWLPVEQYIGGAEHSVLHLLYSRFVTMALKDMGYIDFEEPFTNFFAHGLIIKDGAKMSKSKGNVVVPDEYIAKYGADTLRTYLMFIGPYSDGGDFRDSGIEGMYKFLRKVWKLFSLQAGDNSELSSERLRIMHKTIKKVSHDVKEFSYNTAIASLMEWYNFLNSEVRFKNQELSRNEKETYLKLLAPFAPHMTEELWQEIGDGSIHVSTWPQFEEKYMISDAIVIPVQINGKRRGEFELRSDKLTDQSEAERLAKEAVAKNLEGFEVKKVIYVPGKIINLVI